MPLYEYSCACGAAFSALLPRPEAPVPACRACGAQPRKRISSFAVGGRADPGPGADQAPTSWRATHNGDRETIHHWQGQLERRAKLEERYPELAVERPRVLAHEGRHHHDPLVAPAHGHTHAHPQSQGPEPAAERDG